MKNSKQAAAGDETKEDAGTLATENTAVQTSDEPSLGDYIKVQSTGSLVDANGLPYPAEMRSKGITLLVDAYVLRCLSRGDMSLA